MNDPQMVEGQTIRARRNLYRAILLGSLSFGLLGFVLPIYARQLGASAFDIGGIISVFAVILTIVRPMVGWGIDRFGRRPFLWISFLCYAIALGLFGIAQSLSMLYLARLVQGLGSSLLWIPAYTVSTELTERNWGRAVGSVDMSSSRGAFLGSGLGLALMLTIKPFALAWQISFGIYALLALGASFLIWRSVPETRAAGAWPAAPQENRPDWDRVLRLAVIVFLTSMAMAMLSPLLLIFLQDRFTTNVPSLAQAAIPAALAFAFLPGYMGGLSDRFGRVPLMAMGLMGSGIVSLLMPAMTSLLSLAGLWLLAAVGFSATSPAEGALVADLTGKSVRGRGYGFYTFAAGLGFIVGPLLGGWLYEAVGHAVPFYVNGSTLCICAILVLWLLGRGRDPSITSKPL